MSIALVCLVKGNTSADAFSIHIDRDQLVRDLRKIIKAEKPDDFGGVEVDKLKLWKVQIRDDNDKELNKLTLHDDDQLLATRKISSYFTDQPLDKHIHIIVKPPVPHIRFDLVCRLGLLTEGDSVEYLEKDNYKATLREGRLCTEDGKYRSFTEFIRAARGLKPNENPKPDDFHNLKINGMTYLEVRDEVYKLIFCSGRDEGEDKSNLLFVGHFLNRNKL